MKRYMSLLIAILLLLTPVLIYGAEVSGEIVEVGESEAPDGNYNMLMLKVRTKNREMIEAHLAPQWFMDEDVEIGDTVRLKGRFTNREMLMVQNMIKNRREFKFRNEDNEPLWVKTKLQERECIYNPQSEKMLKGEISNMYMIKNSLKLEAKVKLQNGDTIRVQLAPEYTLRNRIRVGDTLEFRGSEVESDGQNIVLVREMKNLRTEQEIRLRDREGFPVWSRMRHERGKERGRESEKVGRKRDEKRPGDSGRK